MLQKFDEHTSSLLNLLFQASTQTLIRQTRAFRRRLLRRVVGVHVGFSDSSFEAKWSGKFVRFELEASRIMASGSTWSDPRVVGPSEVSV